MKKSNKYNTILPYSEDINNASDCNVDILPSTIQPSVHISSTGHNVVKNLVISPRKTYNCAEIIQMQIIKDNRQKTVDIETWLDYHRPILKDLYLELIFIARNHGVSIINDQQSKNEFIKMMYENSTKKRKDYYKYSDDDYDNN